VIACRHRKCLQTYQNVSTFYFKVYSQYNASRCYLLNLNRSTSISYVLCIKPISDDVCNLFIKVDRSSICNFMHLLLLWWWYKVWEATTARTATPKTRTTRPSVSDWRPSRKPRIAARRSTAKWKWNVRTWDRISATR
jgi:hypothetical protein